MLEQFFFELLLDILHDPVQMYKVLGYFVLDDLQLFGRLKGRFFLVQTLKTEKRKIFYLQIFRPPSSIYILIFYSKTI